MQARKLNIPFDWQPRYHDRVIRNDDEFRHIAAYIEQNPDNWENDVSEVLLYRFLKVLKRAGFKEE